MASNDGKKQFHEEIELAKKGVFDLIKEFNIKVPLEKFIQLCSRIGVKNHKIQKKLTKKNK